MKTDLSPRMRIALYGLLCVLAIPFVGAGEDVAQLCEKLPAPKGKPDLPPRTEDEIIVELEGGQRRLYDAELKRARAHLLGVDTKSALDAVRFHVLASLLRLRQICCHPALVDPAPLLIVRPPPFAAEMFVIWPAPTRSGSVSSRFE